MTTVTTTLVSGQNAYVGAISSRAQYDVSVSSGVQGPAGANGATGNTGANGATGNTGVSVTAANVASGNLIITLSNTSTIDAGSVATNVNATYAWTNTHTFSNTITFTSNVVGNTAGFAIGYRDIPQNFTNTSMTLALTDAGKHILTQNTGSSTQTITIANNTSVAFQTGAAISIVVQSTGTVAVANGAGVTMYLAGNSTAKSTVTLNSYSMATLLKIGTDTWIVSGTGAT